ncbi:LysR family transcriptional regulator [Pandoraea sp. ISTKB]|uniref:LysR family transcriptional regulator n=1 Tax=Pandoraea sp. ISTKB TaxID=1586708 RepID=UPI000847C06B|nr:LysR family transcriptional regulator [Pandoraea sp. ISTKB]ODP34174.1 LysR family transcriptional regulator [Pandoraea sp. ISTKB]
MELRQLRHFIAVAEEGNFTRAAQRCHIVQSALSTSIRSLEDELGAKLFVRTTRHVSLSAAGQAFLDQVRRALDVLDRASGDVADIHAIRKGRLSIGTVQSLPPFLDLSNLMSRFYERYPQIEIRLVQGGAHDLNDKIAAREIDLAILPIEERSEKLTSHIVACDDMVLACGHRHSLAARRNVQLAQLADESFVDFVPGHGTRRLVDRGFAEADVRRRVAFEIGDLDTLMSLVEQGLGVALLPADLVSRRAERLVQVPLKGKTLCWELVVTHLPAASEDAVPPLDPAPLAFLEMLLQETVAARED